MIKFLKSKKSPRRKLIPNKYLIKKYKFDKKIKSKLPISLKLLETISPVIFFKVIVCCGYSFIISLLYQYQLISTLTDNQAVFNAFISINIVLGLTLIIRTNNAQARFWEGCKLWRVMSDSICDLTRGIWLYIEEREPLDRSEKEAAIFMTAAFPIAMKLHLRGQSVNSELKSLVSLKQYH